MSSFEGFLDSVTLHAEVLVVRVVAGDSDPAPSTPPVLVITIEKPSDPEEALANLIHAREHDEGVYVHLPSSSEAFFQTDHGSEITVRGNRVFAEATQYEGKDFERLARFNYDWGQSQYQAHRAATERLNAICDLAREQFARTAVKAQGHDVGSTARTLYEQQLSFLKRLLDHAKP